jgi:hypothetical protein
MAATPLTIEGHAVAARLGNCLASMGNAMVMQQMGEFDPATVQAISARLLELDAAYSPANISTLGKIANELSHMTGCDGNITFLDAAAGDGATLDAIVSDLEALEP